MKPWFKYLGLGFVCYLAFLVVQLPANKVHYLLDDLLVENKVPVKLYGLKGSLWKGSADTVVYDGERFDSLAWEIFPLDLLTGKATIFFRLKGAGVSLKGEVSKTFLGDVILKNIQASAGASEFLDLLKIPAVKLGGEFSLSVSEMILSEKTVNSLHGRLLWSDAESKFPQKLTLGDLYSNFSTTDEGVIQAELGDGGGELELTGDLSVNPMGEYSVKGLFAARAGRNSVLGRSLGFVGRYDSANKVPFDRSGNVSEFGFLIK